MISLFSPGFISVYSRPPAPAGGSAPFRTTARRSTTSSEGATPSRHAPGSSSSCTRTVKQNFLFRPQRSPYVPFNARLGGWIFTPVSETDTRDRRLVAAAEGTVRPIGQASSVFGEQAKRNFNPLLTVFRGSHLGKPNRDPPEVLFVHQHLSTCSRRPRRSLCGRPGEFPPLRP